MNYCNGEGIQISLGVPQESNGSVCFEIKSGTVVPILRLSEISLQFRHKVRIFSKNRGIRCTAKKRNLVPVFA